VTKPLAQSKVALVTTAGLHLRTDRPFIKYDQTFRVIPSSTKEGDILQSQSSIGFDRSLRMRDLNVVFPLDRVHEFVQRGEIGELATDFYSLVGAQDDSEATAEAIGKPLGAALRTEGVDVVLITPTCPVCTHTGGALQRVLEAEGIATVSISLVREYSEKVKPPRVLFTPFPFGAPCGTPGDKAQQEAVLHAAFALLEASSGPVLGDFEAEEGAQGLAPGPVQASAVQQADVEMDVATEASMMRRYYEQWFEREHKTAVGLTGIPVVRFRGVVRFIEAFAAGEAADMRERPADVAMEDWIRYCVDDLKAMYFEGRMAMKPSELPHDAGLWFWTETALAHVLVKLQQCMEASSDAAISNAAFGIAR
jgi:D-proline reductase (dithiol) PrdB